jgi:hypothetical protein
MRLAHFFDLPVIVGPLPNNLANGTTADAVPVMGNFNWLVNQVNANAQPLGTVSTAEWQPIGVTPTYVGSGNVFSVPGDFRSTFLVGRKVQTLGNSGSGTVTGVVQFTPTFGAGITTVTITNDSGSLDGGLNACNVGIVSVAGGFNTFGATSTGSSLPEVSYVAVTNAHNTETITSGVGIAFGTNSGFSSSLYTSANRLFEFSQATGIFTALRAGIYFVSVSASVTTTGVTFSGNCNLGWGGTAQIASLPTPYFMAALAGANKIYTQGSGFVSFNVGQTINATMLLTFSAGTPVLNLMTLHLLGPMQIL